MPPPEQLTAKQRRTQRLITFRLNGDEDTLLRAIAEAADIGPSTLARRIVEHYVREHAPRKTGKRG